MSIYLDASALVKRYVLEPGRPDVLAAMTRESQWVISRVGYVETMRVLPLGSTAARSFRGEWPVFDVVELDHRLADDAADLAAGESLRSLDAIHLASAIAISAGVVATWDRRLHAAATRHGLDVLPARL